MSNLKELKKKALDNLDIISREEPLLEGEHSISTVYKALSRPLPFLKKEIHKLSKELGLEAKSYSLFSKIKIQKNVLAIYFFSNKEVNLEGITHFEYNDQFYKIKKKIDTKYNETTRSCKNSDGSAFNLNVPVQVQYFSIEEISNPSDIYLEYEIVSRVALSFGLFIIEGNPPELPLDTYKATFDYWVSNTEADSKKESAA